MRWLTQRLTRTFEFFGGHKKETAAPYRRRVTGQAVTERVTGQHTVSRSDFTPPGARESPHRPSTQGIGTHSGTHHWYAFWRALWRWDQPLSLRAHYTHIARAVTFAAKHFARQLRKRYVVQLYARRPETTRIRASSLGSETSLGRAKRFIAPCGSSALPDIRYPHPLKPHPLWGF